MSLVSVGSQTTFGGEHSGICQHFFFLNPGCNRILFVMHKTEGTLFGVGLKGHQRKPPFWGVAKNHPFKPAQRASRVGACHTNITKGHSQMGRKGDVQNQRQYYRVFLFLFFFGGRNTDQGLSTMSMVLKHPTILFYLLNGPFSTTLQAAGLTPLNGTGPQMARFWRPGKREFWGAGYPLFLARGNSGGRMGYCLPQDY